MANLDGFGGTKKFYRDDNSVHRIDYYRSDSKLWYTSVYNNESYLIKIIWYENEIVQEIIDIGNDPDITTIYYFEYGKVYQIIYRKKNKRIYKNYSPNGRLTHTTCMYNDGNGNIYIIKDKYYINDILIRMDETILDNVEDWNQPVN
jgi:hypothetical protein